MAKLFGDADKGRALENAVLIELLRHKKIEESIYYLKLKSGKEVDFMVKGRNTELLQVSYDVSSFEVRKRETSALVEAAKTFGLSNCKVITYNYENEEIVDGLKIKFVPFWIWAL